jgi:hypothetical protein
MAGRLADMQRWLARVADRALWALFIVGDTITLGPWRARRHDADLVEQAERYRAMGSPGMADYVLSLRRCRPSS